MPRVELLTLGPLQVLCAGRPSGLASNKVPALLVYLAAEADQAHPRDSLAELLWPERPSGVARHSLSQALTTLRQTLRETEAPEPLLILTRERVQLNPAADLWLDAAEFSAALDAVDRHGHASPETCAVCAAALERATGLYRGDFLAGFSAGDGAGFEQWLLVKREAWRERAVRALALLAEYQAAAGDLEAALRQAQRQLALDPWREPAFRQAMRFLALAGQRSAALAEYERCRQILNTELGLEPEAETSALYERIRAGELIGPAPGLAPRLAPRSAPGGLAAHNLPNPATALIGRDAELQALAERLADPACRLLTLIGPGGAGKTRLALEAGRRQAPAFGQGVCLVNLAPVPSPELLPAALANALEFSPYSAEPLPAQLLRHLRDQHLLLLLDNIEHLLAGAPFLAEVLSAAPRVKLLVTSREQVNLRGEWVFPVEGLSVPASETTEGVAGYSAVQLFVQCARRVQPAFALGPANQADITAICRLVDGLPLALELAAAWLPVLSPSEIAAEIQRNLDFLTADLRDAPERHRSLRAVFDHSWRLLSEAERAVFPRLSVLRGGFTREAAEALAGAPVADLARLTSKSLVRRTAAGHYAIHELLRQYGERKLREHPDEELAARERHSGYFLSYLAAREAPLKSFGQPAALAELTAEMENIRAAWDWAAQAGKAELIAPAMGGFWVSNEILGRYQESVPYFRLAVEALERAPAGVFSRDLAIGEALVYQSSWRMRQGELESASVLGQRGLALLRSLSAQRETAFALNILAAIAHMQGALSDERRLLQESLALGRASGDQWIAGYSLNDLGLVAFLLGEPAEARRLCAESLALFQAIGDPRGLAFALKNLGLIAGQLGELAEAERLLRESLSRWRAQGHRWGSATTLIQLGTVARARGHAAAARAYWREAIQIGLELGAWPPVLDALMETASLLRAEGAHAQAAAMAQAVFRHPAVTAETRRGAARLLAELGVSPGEPAPAVETLAAGLLAGADGGN